MMEYAYGCIPFVRTRDGEITVLMILRHGGYWEFPKGKPEEGEREEETALRELKEETGLTGKLIPEQAISTEYVFHRAGVAYEKKVRFFFCHIADNSPVNVQKAEVNDYAWLPLEDLVERATYPQMKEVARKVYLALPEFQVSENC